MKYRWAHYIFTTVVLAYRPPSGSRQDWAWIQRCRFTMLLSSLSSCTSSEGWRTVARGFLHELPTTETRNPLFSLCYEYLGTSQTGDENLLIQLDRRRLCFRPYAPTTRSDTSPLCSTHDSGHSSRWQTRQQARVEAPTLPSVDAADWGGLRAYANDAWSVDRSGMENQNAHRDEVVLPLVVDRLLTQTPTKQGMRTVISQPRLTCRLAVRL